MADDDGGKGDTDPLGKATRTAKRNLLIASMAVIVVRTFDVITDKIPIAGTTLTVSRDVVEFALLGAVAYFLLTFVLYYYADLYAAHYSEHQKETDERRLTRLKAMQEAFIKEAQTLAAGYRSKDIIARIEQPSYQTYKKWLQGFPPLYVLLWRILRTPNKKLVLSLHRHRPRSDAREASWEPIQSPDEEQRMMLQNAAIAVRKKFASLPFRYMMTSIRADTPAYGVHLMYGLRKYVLDGALPIILALVAILALYNIVDLRPLVRFGPQSPPIPVLQTNTIKDDI